VATDPDPDVLDQLLGVNLRAAIAITGTVAAHLRASGGGRIVHVTSITASVSRGGYLAYEASKAGLAAATRGFAVDLAPYGIVVNAIAPGWIRTPMAEAFLDRCDPEAVADLIPLGRVGEPGEIAEVARWLLLESPAFLTGQTITVDGGQTAHTATL
jgi:NAD(P)-dependent dehydrogenase (short-subunit alcohol dehydrogenase family)